MKRILVVIALAAAGCSSSNPGLGFAVTVPTSSTASALTASGVVATPGSGGLSITDGTHTIVITEAKLVLRNIELERADGKSACSTGTPGEHHDDGCEEVHAGAQVVALPLDGTTSVAINASIAAGTYDKAELKVHKLGSDAADAAIIADSPDLKDASVKVVGTYDGTAFTYIGDAEAEQEFEINPALVVADGAASTGITMSVDAATWFAWNGSLIDPSTANKGGVHEELVDHAIKASLRTFEDDDHDGKPHAEDPDEK